ncbi:MAG TPA: histone deacetylase [Bacteroidetes bacterium]|nr:histone deacetylase [Bacteroidota bacterium]
MIRLSYSEKFPIPLPAGHRFPIQKYQLVREQLLYEGVIAAKQLFSPTFIEDQIIHLTHCPHWWSKAKSGNLSAKEYRQIGFPNSEELVLRSISSASATLQCALNALEDGAGMNLAGGTHHAFFDRGEGFCLLNDIAIAANYLLDRGHVKRVLVVDLDVHQGNGTASLFQGEPNVFTFSMHCVDNYPFHKAVSDLDVGLAAQCDDQTYLGALHKHIPELMESFAPDIVFYQAGVDVLATDRLGKLNLSRKACRDRDYWVISQAQKRNLPLVLVMGGGYSDRLSTLVNAHCEAYKLVLELYEKPKQHFF